MKQLRGFNVGSNNGSNESNKKELLDEAMKKYGGMDETALMAQLLSNVRNQKQNGTYDETQLLAFINNLSPHLTTEQRQKLETVIGALNGDNGKA